MVAQLTTGSTTHKSTSGSSNKMLKLYYTSKLVLFMVCAGNELFFMMVYLGFHNQFWGVRVCALVMMPIFVLKQVLNLVQLVGAANVLVELDVEALKAKHKE